MGRYHMKILKVYKKLEEYKTKGRNTPDGNKPEDGLTNIENIFDC